MGRLTCSEQFRVIAFAQLTWRQVIFNEAIAHLGKGQVTYLSHTC